MPKRTYQPKVKKGKRKHGFLKRMRSQDGRNVLKRRRDKGREKITKQFGNFMFEKKNRLTKQKDFDSVFKAGFSNAFGIDWISSKTFAFFLKLSEI